jgi:hypothetical protein
MENKLQLDEPFHRGRCKPIRSLLKIFIVNIGKLFVVMLDGILKTWPTEKRFPGASVDVLQEEFFNMK